MRHLIVILAFMLAATAARAGDYKSLVFQTATGTEAVDLTSLVLTVSDGKLVATNASGTKSFIITDLSKMYFSTDETSGIKGISGDDTGAALSVYDLQGRKVGSYDSLAAARSALKQGVYVVKQSNETFKIAVQ